MLATSIKKLAKTLSFKGTNRTKKRVAILEIVIRAEGRLMPQASYLLLYTTRSLVYKQPKKIMTSLCCLKFCQILLVWLLICCLNFSRIKCFDAQNISFSLENQ